MAVGRINQSVQSKEINPKLLYQALGSLNQDEIRYLGLERILTL